MSANLSRSQILNRSAVFLSAAAVLVVAYLAFPLLPGSRPETSLAGSPRVKPVAELALGREAAPPSLADVKPDAGSSQRARQMEAELRTLQEEAAKDPTQPTMAQVQRELGRMVAERHGDSEISRLERLAKWSVGLTLLLATALFGLALGNLRGKGNAPAEA